MPGSWQPLKNKPNVNIDATLLLTDGAVLCHEYLTSNWFRLAPDDRSDYANGTWTPVSPMPNNAPVSQNGPANAPLYFASAVLRDGTVFCAGGEDNGVYNGVDLLAAEIYDPTDRHLDTDRDAAEVDQHWRRRLLRAAGWAPAPGLRQYQLRRQRDGDLGPGIGQLVGRRRRSRFRFRGGLDAASRRHRAGGSMQQHPRRAEICDRNQQLGQRRRDPRYPAAGSRSRLCAGDGTANFAAGRARLRHWGHRPYRTLHASHDDADRSWDLGRRP